jgi:hypothetical protein
MVFGRRKNCGNSGRLTVCFLCSETLAIDRLKVTLVIYQHARWVYGSSTGSSGFEGMHRIG